MGIMDDPYYAWTERAKERLRFAPATMGGDADRVKHPPKSYMYPAPYGKTNDGCAKWTGFDHASEEWEVFV